MANWKHEINIRKYLEDDGGWSDEDIVPPAIRLGIIEELKKLPDDLQDATEVSDFIYLLQLEQLTVEEFNDQLDNFYYFADENLIWCGLV